MKKIILLFVLISISLYANNYEQHKLIIKFKNYAPIYNEWNINGRNGKLDFLFDLLGDNNSSSLINNKILERINKNNTFSIDSRNKAGLENLVLVEYLGNIDPLMAAGKLRNHPEIEYAEPLYIRTAVSFPNDTMINRQYYLGRINTYDAWDLLDTTKSILIGIVDTGVDYEHPDLAAAIYINPGEDGLDDKGNDKRTNKIDDDNNGFIDDWHGYDFNSQSDSTGYDNNPMPGGAHGTHVAGITAAIHNNITGIAGVSKIGKILPCKIGADLSFSGSLKNSYNAILYAALMKADVINCSWGGTGASESEQEVINKATEMGSLIVAAAGNNNKLTSFFPASYNNVLSVAASDEFDKRASFSNYHSTVDVVAPGAGIYSTLPNDSYASWDGTSMASPVAAGVAAMVKANHPEYKPIQISEHIKATCDSIYYLNPDYIGKLGNGRVSAINALSNKNPKNISLMDYKFTDFNSNRAYEPGEEVVLNFTLINALSNTDNIVATAHISSAYKFQFVNDKIDFQSMKTMEIKSTKDLNKSIKFTIPDSIPNDYDVEITLDVTDNQNFKNTYSLVINLNPTYRTIDFNNITTTITSIGTIAFNDFPNNEEGDGFSYKNSLNIIYEGNLLVAMADTLLSNNARNSGGSNADNDFYYTKPLKLYKTNDELYTNASLKSRTDSSFVPVTIDYTVHQYHKESGIDTLLNDMVFLQYDLRNETLEFQNKVFIGLYNDWDIGVQGANNYTKWDSINNFAYIYNKIDSTLPFVGMLQLTDNPTNYFAIDNDGSSDDNPGVYDGFTKAEKIKILTGKIQRHESGVKDVSCVISAGPLMLNYTDTARVVFVYFAGNSIEDLTQKAKYLHKNGISLVNSNQYLPSKPNKLDILRIFPNPNSGSFKLRVALPEVSKAELAIYDISGKKVLDIPNQFIYNDAKQKYFSANYQLDINNLSLPIGKYFIQINTDFGTSSTQLIIGEK